LISQRFLQSIAVLSFAPALKLNAHFRGQSVFMPAKFIFNLASSPSELLAQ
jgi:hypothetical protein